MKKNLIQLALMTVLSYSAWAQQPDKALARVRYTFTHVRDTTQRDKPYTENMLLITGQNASVYTSYDKINRSAALRQQIQEQISNQAGSATNIRVQNRETRPVSQIDYFRFSNEGKLIIKERIFNNYLIEEPIPRINWKISKDTASFSGLLCQKATARFKGRDWTVWFAPELPFSSGPWKLNGLPGLIVEAYDAAKEVSFKFAGLEKVAPSSGAAESQNTGTGTAVKLVGIDTEEYLGNEIKLPANAIRSTRSELDKLKTAYEKDPEGFLSAQMAAQGMKGNFKISRSLPDGVKPVKPAVNNPIELSEK
ncbi:GLPGLI family protein [Pedobacter sp. SYP-B3415]|uniref:GLPGLI family protein n=1 Tax=Pedobacter sp. SYP-B3415 TaxID=2496641 RepID=UPI00101D351A|nr:GLPGLI family protein [Pedobacter sp. SYP-B3415]